MIIFINIYCDDIFRWIFFFVYLYIIVYVSVYVNGLFLKCFHHENIKTFHFQYLLNAIKDHTDN